MINGELIVDNFAGGGGASTGIYEDGTVAEADSTWCLEASGEWIESYGCYVIPVGWFEYKHYSHEGCCLNCAIEDEVIAWMPFSMICERYTEGKMKLIDADLLKSRLLKRIRTKRSTMEILKDIFPLIDNMPSVKTGLDELQEYREIGTVSECQDAMERIKKLKKWTSSAEQNEKQGEWCERLMRRFTEVK